MKTKIGIKGKLVVSVSLRMYSIQDCKNDRLVGSVCLWCLLQMEKVFHDFSPLLESMDYSICCLLASVFMKSYCCSWSFLYFLYKSAHWQPSACVPGDCGELFFRSLFAQLASSLVSTGGCCCCCRDSLLDSASSLSVGNHCHRLFPSRSVIAEKEPLLFGVNCVNNCVE